MKASLTDMGTSSLLAIGILFSTIWQNPSFAGTQFRSGPAQVSLLELYTSQGCNSCPPADEWISSLSSQPGLWEDYIPIAFHVDYWDYIGWKDRFARPDFGQRQSRYHHEGGIVTVYTPGVVLNGREWRQWRSALAPNKSNRDTGLLTVDIDAGTADIQFLPAEDVDDELVANVAILGFDLVSEIRAGENVGRTLKNDFVVLALDNTPMTRKDDFYISSIELPSTRISAERYAAVIWVSSDDKLLPLQAVGGWYSD